VDNEGAHDEDSPYYDSVNNRLLPPELRHIIDRIVYDLLWVGEVSAGRESEAIVQKWAGHLPEAQIRQIRGCAGLLFDQTVEGDLEQARHNAQMAANTLVDGLPARIRDLLLLSTKVADREQLLSEFLSGLNAPQRSWVAYFAKRDATERFEASMADRYSAAARTLMGRGWTMQATAGAMQISTNRLNAFLSRDTATDLDDDDPLCELIPDLRGAKGEWSDFSPIPAEKRAIPSMPMSKRMKLAASSDNPDVLELLALDKASGVVHELLNRQRDRGDLSAEVLARLLSHIQDEWGLHAAWDAYQANPFHGEAEVKLARHFPAVLLTCDDDAAGVLTSEDSAHFLAAVALRDEDVDSLMEILTGDVTRHSWKQLRDLLVGFPLPEGLAANETFAQTIINAAARMDSSDDAIALRLVACQNDSVRNRYVDANGLTAEALMSPEELVSQALGPYNESSRIPRSGVMAGARALWSTSDLTTEHGQARSVVAESGSYSCVIETKLATYEATPDAIYSFAKTEEKAYTYVHLYLTTSLETDLPGSVLVMQVGLPALGYHWGSRPHPDDPTGPEVPVIVWPLPLSPAIYSLGIEPNPTGNRVAVAGGQCSVIADLASNGIPADMDFQWDERPETVCLTLRDAVQTARQVQEEEGDGFGVGVALPSGQDTKARFLQWCDVEQTDTGWTLDRIEALVESPQIQGQLIQLGFQLDEGLNVWVDLSRHSWATEEEMLTHICGLLELIGAEDGMALTAYP
jgi:hypothetical protein